MKTQIVNAAPADATPAKPAPAEQSEAAAKAVAASTGGIDWWRNGGIGVVSVVSGLVLWEVVSRFLVANPLFLAAPSQIFFAMVQLAKSGRLGHDIGVSTVEFLLGYGIASLLGIVLGLVMASSERAKQALQPWVSGLYATPTIALGPLFIVWMGIGIWSKVVVVILLVIFPVAINTEAGLRTTSERLVETLRCFGATRKQIFFKLSLPSATPFILAGLKLGIGRGLIGVVVAELFGSRAGLGLLISESADSFNMPNLFVGVLIFAIAGIAIIAGFSKLERKLVPWTKE
ncbi:MAG: nitrate transporter permease [Herminiimonas sp.]|nr:nitrate transporter permease [Herminiimonas sp.]